MAPPGFTREDLGQPPTLVEAYRSTVPRAPHRAPIRTPHTLTEITGPAGPWDRFGGPPIPDLSVHDGGAAQGQRIIVSGRVVDEDRRPVAATVVEIWQANAAGRYRHEKDQWDAPLDPHFGGHGRVVTDEEGRYRFVTIRPGAYPWQNHHNAWRPAHIHLSLFGPAFATRLVTQMYFPGDDLIDLDPIASAVAKPYRGRLVSRFDLQTTEPAWALGYAFDIVLRGREATPMEAPTSSEAAVPDRLGQTPSQTIGPFFHGALPWAGSEELAGSGAGRIVEVAGRVVDGAGAPVTDGLLEIWQANAAGLYACAADDRRPDQPNDDFIGFGRHATDADGQFRFRTVFPGRAPGPGGRPQAPHIAVSVFGRGLLKRLATRIYFEDGEGNDADEVLALVPAERRQTLIARRAGGDSYRFDIVLQGDDETVFFDV
jgi:protocatechuate 3,4-dioxygenase beta subunit